RGDGARPARDRRAGRRARADDRPPLRGGRAVPARRRPHRRRLPGLDGRHGEGRGRRARRRRPPPHLLLPSVPRGGRARAARRRCRGDRARPRGRARLARTALHRARRDAVRQRRRAARPRLRAGRARASPGRHPRGDRRDGRPLRWFEERAMSRLKTLAANQCGVPPLAGGHSLCQGCGIPIVVRTVLNSIPGRKVIVNATGCLEVATTRYPTTAWNLPWLHVAFENAAAVASGVESAYRALARRGGLPQDGPLTFVVFGGDGGTYDIGLQALSGALERRHRFLYVCYDNEAYMNTGIQRSGATTFGALPATRRAGLESFGKSQQRKDMTAIAVAYGIPYAAQAAGCDWYDLSWKAERAASAGGPAFLNVLTDCPLGWGHEPRLARQVLRAAVESRFWPLYEVEGGRYTLTYEPAEPVPVEEWLLPQARFAHLL